MIDVRNEFLQFFLAHKHKIYPSMPLVPDDASLLFTNAGMVQFKDIFTGNIPSPKNPRATSSQLCIRAGGKHNDLENVGYTARHHTLFEMLGNFSFGDYFKEEAISLAWEFITKTLAFPKDKLYVSVHHSDDEAFRIWSKFIDSTRIKKMGDKDNFWQMGDVGPCGPCSEIYIDQGEEHFHTDEDYFGGDGDRFLEIWNLVFMQYERDKEGNLKPLPKPSIDTGMGLERVVALKEGKINNFDTSLFAPLMRKIEALTGQKYYEDNELLGMSLDNNTIKSIQSSFRVIADHARSVAFLLAQGTHFDKEGRGYVLRRILRRAVRHGYLLGLRKAFVYEVVCAVCDSMGGHYSYLLERKEAIQKACKAEEKRFFETIENGMSLFNKELDSTHNVFSGEAAFKLYDTYGFPLDLTQDMLREHNLQVDIESFEKCMNAQKLKAKASWKGSGDEIKEGDFASILEEFGENEFIGYTQNKAECKILALLDSNYKRTKSITSNGYVFFDKTPLYAEGGGPVGDSGEAFKDNKKIADIIYTKKYFGLNISEVRVINPLNALKVGDLLTIVVNSNRTEIAKHHSATHLLHLALREILGHHIAQAGSLVEPNRLRFDFSHPSPITPAQLAQIQDNVNLQICAANAQVCENMDIESAKKSGAIALFNQKYKDNVRVISFGDSKELCGGIHTPNTAHIGSFYIIKESGVSSGVRRIEAVCGKAGYEYSLNAIKELESAKAMLKTPNLPQAIEKLKAQIKADTEAKSKVKQSLKGLGFVEISGVKVVVALIEGANNSDLKDIIDRLKNEEKSVAGLVITHNEGKVSIVSGVKNAPIKANQWVKIVAKGLNGNGGGREDFATAGGKISLDSKQAKEDIGKALKSAKNYIKDALKG